MEYENEETKATPAPSEEIPEANRPAKTQGRWRRPDEGGGMTKAFPNCPAKPGGSNPFGPGGGPKKPC